MSIDIYTTPYGQISRSREGWTFIVANAQETYDWANKPDSSWPNSALSTYAIEITLDEHGDLVDLETDAYDGEFLSDELDAFIADVKEYRQLHEEP